MISEVWRLMQNKGFLMASRAVSKEAETARLMAIEVYGNPATAWPMETAGN